MLGRRSRATELSCYVLRPIKVVIVSGQQVVHSIVKNKNVSPGTINEITDKFVSKHEMKYAKVHHYIL